MIALPIIALVVAGVYLFAVYNKTKGTKEGIPESISRSYYLWKGSKLGGWEFILFIVVMSWSVIIFSGQHGNSVGWDNMTDLQTAGYVAMIFGGFLLFIIGVFAHFSPGKTQGEKKSAKVRLGGHLAGSYAGIGIPMLFGLWAAFGWYYCFFGLAFVAAVVLMKVKKIPDFIFWVETAAIGIGFLSLIVVALT